MGRISNRKSLNVTRKIVGPGGPHAGTVMVPAGLGYAGLGYAGLGYAGLDYLERFLTSLTTHGVIELVGREDGIIRSRAPVDDQITGTVSPERNRMTGEGGVFLTYNAKGAVQRIESYRSLTFAKAGEAFTSR